MAIILARVPGDLSPPLRADEASVHATMAVGTSVAASTVLPQVLTTMVCPEINSPGAWPVCTVVTPKSRTHLTSGSWMLNASTARSSGCIAVERSNWS
jgi:hypothetical protein